MLRGKNCGFNLGTRMVVEREGRPGYPEESLRVTMGSIQYYEPHAISAGSVPSYHERFEPTCSLLSGAVLAASVLKPGQLAHLKIQESRT